MTMRTGGRSIARACRYFDRLCARTTGDCSGRRPCTAAWQREVVPKLNAVERYNFAKTSEVYGRRFLLAARAGRVFSDLYDLGTTAAQFSCGDVVDRVSAPTLVTTYEHDQLIIPASQGTEVYKKLPSRKEYHHFTAAEGAQYHCAPMAPRTRNQVVYDWLDRTL
jgi:hypothetical protein